LVFRDNYREGRKRMKLLRLVGAALVAAMASSPVLAQDYPSKTITLVCPYAPGGATDGYTRAFADYLERKRGLKVVVENRDGAGGVVGTDYVRNAAPDGYVIEYLSSSTLLSYAFTGKDFEAGKDIDAVGGVNQTTTIWVVNPKVIPVKTLPELIEYLKANPGESYATVGVGSTAHLTMLDFAGKSGIEVEHIPYRGGAAAMAALVAGEIGLVAGSDPASALPQIKAGRVVPLAIAGPNRLDALPDVPTTVELGHPDITTISFGGFAAPHGTPKEITAVIAEWVKDATEDPQFRQRLAVLGTEVVYRDPATLTTDLNQNARHFGAIIKKYNLR
jgi:tripartite-type tricarboxylate transporter receptor subunit TctC